MNPISRANTSASTTLDFLPKPVQKPHPPIWVRLVERVAQRCSVKPRNWPMGLNPLGSNPAFPMGTPMQLTAGLERLATYARSIRSRPLGRSKTIYRRLSMFELTDSASRQRPFAITSVALSMVSGDIREYEAVGVSSLVLDFQSSDRGPGRYRWAPCSGAVCQRGVAKTR